MKFYTFINFILIVIISHLVIYSSGDELKKLIKKINKIDKKKLIALGILSGLRVKKLYAVPVPLPLPLPVIIKKSSPPIILPPKKYPVLVPKPVPVYHLVPKFIP